MIPLFLDLEDGERRVVDVLHSVDGWPIDFGKDAEFVRRMLEVYPSVDLYEEAVAWATWMTEHETKKQIKHRARFRNWLKKAEEFRGRNTKKHSSHRNPENEGHGDTVETRRNW